MRLLVLSGFWFLICLTLGSDEMGLGLVDWMCNPPGFALFLAAFGEKLYLLSLD